MYDAPVATVEIRGDQIQFVANLHAYCAMQELAVRHPEFYDGVDAEGRLTDDESRRIGYRMRTTPESVPAFLAAFAPQVDWQAMVKVAPPWEVLAAYNACDRLLQNAQDNWNPAGEDDSPFRDEPA